MRKAILIILLSFGTLFVFGALGIVFFGQRADAESTEVQPAEPTESPVAAETASPAPASEPTTSTSVSPAETEPTPASTATAEQKPAEVLQGESAAVEGEGEEKREERREKEEKKGEGKKEGEELFVSLDFKDADIADVLSALSKAYGLNIIAGKEITGTVSVSLENVMLDDALEAVLGLNGYSYTKEKNIITVLSPEDQVVTEVLRLEFAEADEVKDLFKNVLSEKGDLKVNERLNEILITDNQTAIKKARELLYQVDTAPPQVIIEAKLVDIDPKDLANLGADLDINYLANVKQGNESVQYDVDFDYNLSGPSGSLGGDDLKLDFTIPLFTPTNSITIDSLLQKTKANLLSAPRIAALNNQPAKIVIGEKVGIREQTQTASGTIESVRFVDVGITLKVTPQINRGGYVTMEVTTEVSSVSSFVDNLPRITTREATTTVRVKDRQTVIIAGLLKDEYSETASSFPLLTHIPIIGQILGNFANSRERKELVVFLTPQILYVADRVDPDDKEAMARQEADLDGARIKHEEVISDFRKGGMSDAVDMNVGPWYGEKENFFERAQWLERKGIHKYSSRRDRSIRKQYLFEAASAYQRFAEAFPSDQRSGGALKRAAEIYDEELGNTDAAYEAYRLIVTEHADSRFADDAIRSMEKIKKAVDKRDKDKEKRQEKLLSRLEVLEVKTDEIGDTPHAKIPVPSA